MEQILGLRPFVPTRDFALSQLFYQALGFTPTHTDQQICILKLESFSFILQNYFVQAFAENCMLQLLVRDVDAWWRRVDAAKLVADFTVREPRPPAMQEWGLKVGFLFDPSGVLWHIAEAQF